LRSCPPARDAVGSPPYGVGNLMKIDKLQGSVIPMPTAQHEIPVIDAATRFKVNVIGGCGHVGLPLAIALAAKGHEVCIHDINERSIETIRSGKLPFLEGGAEPLLARALESKQLELSADPASISKADVVVFIIGTPVDEHLNPEFPVI